MPDIKGAVTKKVGPLPLWGWAVAGVAAVFVAGRFKGGGSSSAVAGDGIKIPTLTPGSASDVGTGAVGSPSQNAQGGMDTQPAGVVPWWAVPPNWWGTGIGGLQDTANTAGGGGNTGLQTSATAGVKPPAGPVGQTAGALAKVATPGYTQTTATNVAVKQPDSNVGGVAPGNVLKGYGPGGIPIYG